MPTATVPKRIVTSDLVAEVSRTAIPHTLLGWELTVDHLIAHSRPSDWENGLYQLTRAGANRLAGLINEQQPWRTPVKTDTPSALTILTGELVAITPAIEAPKP